MSEQAGENTFTPGRESARLLEELAKRCYADNQTETVRVALRHLAAQLGVGEKTWVVHGYIPIKVSEAGTCHRCGGSFEASEIVYRPVFKQGSGPGALSHLPGREVLRCSKCAEQGS